jgi:hypothetical protein
MIRAFAASWLDAARESGDSEPLHFLIEAFFVA